MINLPRPFDGGLKRHYKRRSIAARIALVMFALYVFCLLWQASH